MMSASCPCQQQVAEAIDVSPESRKHHRRRAVLLDDRRLRDEIARLQAVARVDGALDGLPIEPYGPASGTRALRTPVAHRTLRNLWATDRPDPRHAEIDPLDDVSARTGVLHVAVAIAEALLVRIVEARGDLLGPRVIDRAGRSLDADFPGLAEVSEVRRALKLHDAFGEAFAMKRLAGQSFETVQMRVHRGMVQPIVTLNERLDVVVLHVDDEQTERREIRGRGRDQRRS